MKLVVVPAALGELRDAAAFYAATDEFERAVNVILANPEIGVVFRGPRRRYLLRRFPYSVTAAAPRRVAVAGQPLGAVILGRRATVGESPAPNTDKVYFAARIATVPASSGTQAFAHRETR